MMVQIRKIFPAIRKNKTHKKIDLEHRQEYKPPRHEGCGFRDGQRDGNRVVTPEREKRQAAVDSSDARVGTERFS